MSNATRPDRRKADIRIRDGLRELNQANVSDPEGTGGYGELVLFMQISKEMAIALDHMGRSFQALDDAGRIDFDSGEPADTPQAAIDALTAARAKVDEAASALDTAAWRRRFLVLKD